MREIELTEIPEYKFSQQRTVFVFHPQKHSLQYLVEADARNKASANNDYLVEILGFSHRVSIPGSLWNNADHRLWFEKDNHPNTPDEYSDHGRGWIPEELRITQPALIRNAILSAYEMAFPRIQFRIPPISKQPVYHVNHSDSL